ncbi:MAG: O-antigen ligase family protein [Aequorivita sp.]|nr:O-antigen ligase family protein [Aequorivita sp.]
MKLFIYLLLVINSILLSSYGNNPIAYYRWIELFFVAIGVMTVINFTEKNKNLNLDIIIQKSVFFNFQVILAVLLAFTILNPEMAYQLESQGRFRLGGSLYSPNLLGIILTLSFLSSLIVLKRNILIFSTFLITSILIYLTDSRTSLLIYAFCVLLLIWKKTIFTKAIILFSFSILFMFLLESIISSVDKSGDLSTINNRLPIYETIIAGIKTHPLTGLGYVEGVRYYLDQNFPQSFWKPPHTHNSYLETLSSLGIIFGSLTLLYIFKILIYSIRTIAASKDNLKNIISIQIIAILLGALTIPTFGNIVNPTFAFLIFFLIEKNRAI